MYTHEYTNISNYQYSNTVLPCQQFSSVTGGLIIKIMTAALTCNNCKETFQFYAGQRTVWVSVMLSWSPAADCSTLTDQRLKRFMDQSQLGHPDLPSICGDM